MDHLKQTVCLLLALALMVGAGCEREEAGETPDRSEQADESGESPLVAKSDELPDEPTRIVSLAPNVTEMLFALGVGDRVVAVTSHCDYPEEVSELPSVGSFANPDFETIVAKKPDLVVGVVSGNDRGIFERLKAVDVPYGFVRTDTIEETMGAIELVGRWVDRSERAASLTETMRTRLDKLRERWRMGPAPSVLLVYGHEPLVAAGPGTFGHQLIEAAGANNVLGDVDIQFPRLDIEKIVELKPSVILDTAMVESPDDDDFWSAREAVEAEVRYLTDPVVLRPGPRLPEALGQIGEAIYRSEASETAGGDGGGR